MEYKSGKEHLEHLDANFADLHEEDLLTAKQKRKLVLKLDIRLLPICWILYFVNLLDRVAVGSSVAYGLRRDLGINGNTYNLGISLFYVFYCLAEIPSNLILKAVSARIWVPAVAICFAAVTLATAFISNGSQFLGMRILLGLTESTTLPGISYFLSTYYDRDQLALRLPLFISASALASGVGSLLATAQVSAGQITPLIYSWRNIFFINGLITFPVAIAGFFLLPSSPATTRMLKESERDYMLTRSKRLTAGLAIEEKTRVTLVLRVLKNPHVLFAVVPWFCAQVLASSLTFFLATILREQFGYSPRQANLHVSYTFFFSFGMTILLGYASDRTGKHAPFVLAPIVAALIGSCMFFYARNPTVRYVGTFLGNVGIFGGVGINTAWATSNTAPYTTRAAGSAFLISVGSLGGLVGAWVFLPSEATRGYPTGAVITLVFLCLGIVSVLAHWYYCIWENKQRALGKRDYRLNGTPDEVALLGNLHPHFVLAT